MSLLTITLSAVESAYQKMLLAMALVLRETFIVLTLMNMNGVTLAVSALVRSIIMIVMEPATQRLDPVMDSVQMDTLHVEGELSAAVKSLIMIAMEPVPQSLNPAMERV